MLTQVELGQPAVENHFPRVVVSIRSLSLAVLHKSAYYEPPTQFGFMKKIKVEFSVNGQAQFVDAHPMERLLDVLREQLHLTGTKEGCGEGECGACSVVMDGRIVNSCLVPVAQVEGATIKTIEGVASGEQLHAVQQAFIECGGAQCGICTPGMVMAAVDLLERNPHPNESEVRNGLAGNLCRCTGYMKIFESVVRACQGGIR